MPDVDNAGENKNLNNLNNVKPKDIKKQKVL